MRAAAMVGFLVIGASAQAQRLPQDATNAVNVYINEDVSDGRLNLGWARSITSRILAESGVRIKWRFGQPRRGEPCMPIVIDLRSNTPETVAPGVLAFAQVYEGVHIRVFWDRVQNTVRGANPLGTFLLAHVMAHEIAHILEGIDRHSETGLMKASWTQREIEQMTVRPLSLSPEDVRLIRDGPVKRVAEHRPTMSLRLIIGRLAVDSQPGAPNRYKFNRCDSFEAQFTESRKEVQTNATQIDSGHNNRAGFTNFRAATAIQTECRPIV